MAEYEVDTETGTVIMNDTEIASSDVSYALSQQHPELAALVRWTASTQRPASRHGSMLDRDRYVTPTGVFDQMRVAYDAAEHDDVVSGVVESTESLAFAGVSIESMDEDEENVWEQIGDDLDLESRLREIWREMFIVSQCYVGVWWGQRDYKVGGRTKAGIKRKKAYTGLTVPIGMTILDPLKIMPVGNFLFNKDQLAYIADRSEANAIDAAIAGDPSAQADPIFSQIITGKYQATDVDRKALANMNDNETVDPNRLYLLNPQNVFRHTATRSQYQPFATVRMKSIFELLDLKHQLRQMDRSTLIGATNFIVVIKKGSDALPAKADEIAALSAQAKMVARVPLLIGDHRLSVEIITPKTDSTLQPERYNGIDARITARLYQVMMSGNFAAGAKGDDSIKLAKVVARGLESRRHMIRRSIERHVLRATLLRNEGLTEEPSLRFHPKRIALDFDPALATLLFDLWTAGATSLESMHEEIDFDTEIEAQRRKHEKDIYKGVFVPDVLPAGSPGLAKPPGSNPTTAPADPKSAGRTQGGNRSGGGAAPGSGQGKPAQRPRPKGTPEGTKS